MTEDASLRLAQQIKRLILCFDGTWNTPEDHTNVSRIYAAIADKHSGCPGQLKFYDEGVGTTATSRLRGGALGWGLDRNILQGYCWLINEYGAAGPTVAGDTPESDEYAAGPDILLFGFSRGAYTARSLAGLINRCGVPRADKFEGERADPDAPLVREAWELYKKDMGKGESRFAPVCVKFRREHSHNVKVKFIGVWDTVGALGVPAFSKSLFARARYGFHDTSLGRTVEHAYHAVAIDEAREDYEVSLWTGIPGGAQPKVEQRWFPGAHANVGGGYADDLLPDPPLKWIAECAIQPSVGLEFTEAFNSALATSCSPVLPEDFKLRGDEYLSPVRDSYAEFMHGAYRFFRTIAMRGRYFRRMLVDGIGETIDRSAHMKWAADPSYRPANLAHAGRTDFMAEQRLTPVEVPAAPAAAGNG